MMVTVSSAPILTQTFGSKTPAASAVLVSRKPGTYPPTSSAPPAALTFKKVRLVSVFVICRLLNAGRAMNSAADSLICSASADVPRHGGVNFRIGWFRFFRKQRRSRHQLTRLTVAALRHLLGDPGGLQRVARGRRKSFDGRDLLRSHIRYRGTAGTNSHSIEVDRAGSALLQSASELRSCQTYRVTYHPEQWRVRAYVNVILFSVYR